MIVNKVIYKDIKPMTMSKSVWKMDDPGTKHGGWPLQNRHWDNNLVGIWVNRELSKRLHMDLYNLGVSHLSIPAPPEKEQ